MMSTKHLLQKGERCAGLPADGNSSLHDACIDRDSRGTGDDPSAHSICRGRDGYPRTPFLLASPSGPEGGTGDSGAGRRGRSAPGHASGQSVPTSSRTCPGLRHRRQASLPQQCHASSRAGGGESGAPLSAYPGHHYHFSPLLGLLGTITGMISAFGIVSEAGLGQPHAITGGIAEALIATATGLLVAIVTLIPYNYFRSRMEAMTDMIEERATRLELLLGKRED